MSAAPGGGYHLLTESDQQRLRLERIRLIEADLYRATLQLEDALSDQERDEVAQEIAALRERLRPHYQALGLLATEQASDNGSSSGA